ncbi:MAG TPA: hypothetical protein VFH89_02950 [Sphingomicrobium sp.]|nr:hypothetical protein [Sphingomicrobium sp.]
MATVISDEYRAEQQELHKNPKYGVASLSFAPVVRALLRLGSCTSLSDYGAGKCNLKRALRLRDGGQVRYQPYDPAFPDYGAPQPAELVTCIDVLEHIEPKLLDAVISDIASISRKLAFLTIHTGPAKKTLSDGRNAHLIQESTSWWLAQFEPYFDVLHVQQVRKGFFVIACPKGAYRSLALELDLPRISREASRLGGRRRKPLRALIRKLTGASSAAIVSLGIAGDDLAATSSAVG